MLRKLPPHARFGMLVAGQAWHLLAFELGLTGGGVVLLMLTCLNGATVVETVIIGLALICAVCSLDAVRRAEQAARRAQALHYELELHGVAAALPAAMILMISLPFILMGLLVGFIGLLAALSTRLTRG